jgi:hypothetical protein
MDMVGNINDFMDMVGRVFHPLLFEMRSFEMRSFVSQTDLLRTQSRKMTPIFDRDFSQFSARQQTNNAKFFLRFLGSDGKVTVTTPTHHYQQQAHSSQPLTTQISKRAIKSRSENGSKSS